MVTYSELVGRLFACPNCLESLPINSNGATCAGCGAEYRVTQQGQLDLRLRGTKRVSVEHDIGDRSICDPMPDFSPIPENTSSQIDYRSIPLSPSLARGNRVTRELLSHFPRSKTGGAMLDLGCGGEPYRDIAPYTNLEYVGMDYDIAPHLLGDGHALPFKDNAFDFVTSFAVFEHIRYPFVAMREVVRVMKPGAVFIGTVAFLEPYHLNSFYHMSHLGTINLLADAGLKIKHIEPNAEWNGLRAQGWMSLFPHMPMWLTNLAVLPVHLLSRLYWMLGHAVQNRPATSETARRVANTAGYRWVCEKP
jgi:SAM-dependent methyltransferase